MNASTGKTLGIILVALLALMLLWPLKLLFFGPAGIIDGISHGFRNFDLRFDRIHWGGWPFIGAVGLFGLAMLALLIGVLVWVYRDAESRGMQGALWAVIVFFAHLPGLIVYLIVRSSHQAPAAKTAPTPSPPPPPGCPRCGKIIDKSHAYCPQCGERLAPPPPPVSPA
jgi:hypothetical protein